MFVLTIDADATATLRVAVGVTEDGDMIDSPAPTMVTIQAGANTAMLSVATVDDGIDEQNSNITAKLKPGSGYQLGSVSTGVVTVLDNDGDDTPPLLVDASVDGDQVTLNYDEPLDSTSTPDAAGFTVTVTGDSNPPIVTDVEVSGMTVTLTLDRPVAAGATVSVSYEPSGSPIRDIAGNESAGFTDHPVANETPASSARNVPAFDAPQTKRRVLENTPPSEPVGLPVVLANDEDGTSVYTLSGDDVDWFTIDAATGQIRVGADADMDYEGFKNSFSVVVTATTTAGKSASVDVTIDIIDINLGPYDVDHNEQIDMNEALAAARDYFDDMIEMAETTRVVRLYLYP